MDLKNTSGKAPAKSLIYIAENTGGEGGKAPSKSLKTRRRKAEKKSPLIVPPLRRVPGLPPGRAIAADAPSTERRELWPWVAVLGLLLLMGEWLYSQRIIIRRSLIERRARRALQGMENG